MRHAIKSDSTQLRLEKCAERLRLAKLAVFKMEYSRDSVLPVSTYQPGDEAKKWIEMDVDKIIDLYR